METSTAIILPPRLENVKPPYNHLRWPFDIDDLPGWVIGRDGSLPWEVERLSLTRLDQLLDHMCENSVRSLTRYYVHHSDKRCRRQVLWVLEHKAQEVSDCEARSDEAGRRQAVLAALSRLCRIAVEYEVELG